MNSSFPSEKTVLIIGAGGFLGGRLTQYLESRVRVVRAVHSLSREKSKVDLAIDVTDISSVVGVIESSQAGVVVNCSGITSVDVCHQRPEAAILTNAIGAHNISQAARAAKTRFVQISTDHFASNERRPRKENDCVFPINQYGKSKLLAEQLIIDSNPEALIVRTNFFGVGRIEKNTFFDELLQWFTTGADIDGFRDVTFSPIGVEVLCNFIYTHLSSSTHGVVHVVGSQELTKLDFVCEVKKEFGDSRSNINSISIKDAGLASKRPSYMSLSNERLRNEFDFTPPELSHMIRHEIQVARKNTYLSTP